MTDFVLTGGHVIDPADHVDGPRNVYVRNGKIVAVLTPNVPPPAGTAGFEAIDVKGAFVTPGFVDLHGHWFEGSAWGIDPIINLKSGVTTPCDAGTSGYETFTEFRKRTIDTSPVKVLVFLHIGSLGCITMNAGEIEDFRFVRVGDTVETIERNRDVIVGIKARLGTQPAGDNIYRALDATLDAAEQTKLPALLHVSGGADLRRILPKLRPGDIVTHTFIADDGGLIFGGGRDLLREVRDAKERGVVFDVGHGCGSFSWDIYRRAAEQGFSLDTISTDLHRLAVEGPVYDMLTTMSKFLYLGMPVGDIVAATTSRPAAAVRRQGAIGSLAVGRRADIAVFRIEDGRFDYVDAFGKVEHGKQRFAPVLTVNGGEVVRPEGVKVALRPYTQADREMACGAPLMSLPG
jgi:dihydroorotase